MSSPLLRVTEEEIAAAQLRVVLDQKLDRQTPEVIRRIAAMTGAAPVEQQRTSPDPGATQSDSSGKDEQAQRGIDLPTMPANQAPPDPVDEVVETVVDPSAGAEQRAIEVDAARALWDFVEELPLRQRILVRALFTDHPRPYAEIARSAGIPVGAIGPTRARALAQLRRRLDELARGPST